jgi:glycosyltransferase involved in cell wall biosynthesis
VTVSEHSRRGIVEHFRVPAESVHVVGEASDPVFRVLDDLHSTPRLDNLGLSGGRSVVYVGGFSPHKNLEMLVAAFARVAACDDLTDVRLVLVGEYEREVFHSYSGRIRRQVEDLGLGHRVVFTGFLADEELVVLLNRATVLALPSLLEGFGLPAVEAAACGCPVVATTASPLADLLGDGGLFVDPTDRPGWERALLEVLRASELRQRLRENGLEAARRLTWDAAARQLLAVLHKVAA